MNPTLILRAAVLCLGLLLSSCTDDANPETTADTSDLASDTTQPADLQDQADDTPDVPEARLPEGAACSAHTQCERALICDAAECSSVAGCAGFGPPPFAEDTGCIIWANTVAGFATAIECESNDDCAGSEYGPNCARRVCTELTPCADDSDCTGAQICFATAVCVDP